jgi:hypothetical protein
MKVRATKAMPGRLHIKVIGTVSKWIEPFPLDGKPGKWVDLPDGNADVDKLVDMYHEGGQLEVSGRVTFRSFQITQCAGSPNCTEPIASKDFNLCYHHMMKLYRGLDKSKTDEEVAVAEDKIAKAAEQAEKDNAKSQDLAKKQVAKKGAKKSTASKQSGK